ncbi:G-type lectin S-receptor-like serine/threonine-protein kinase LECRK1 [Juglans regia]|uniref:Receptor-like serine/threonine-protein kinase n=1 Tax=Juglans regia TaxID=51240 RepID=A0A6P9EFB6_JUGRE|nr:G-type lectin S-receptor-like serine/threonine-protein kinase LECRK1 [Juglans regia]
MVAIFLSLLLITGFSATIAQEGNSSISLGSSLSPITKPYWLSGSGQFAFGFYQIDGGFAIGIWLEKIRQKTVVWTANRDNPPLSKNVKLFLANDGRLVLEQEQGQQTALTNNALFSASSASMLNTGNFVLYNSSSNIIWQTFDAPTDTILPDQPLVAGNKLVSSSSETNHARGKFQLIMQHDGNLVQYPSDIPPKLFLRNLTGIHIKNLNGQGNTSDNFSLYRLTLGFDGILRLYSHRLDQDDDNWSIEWSPSSSNCDPIGLCGLNAYCTVKEHKAVCTCPPGFDFLDGRQPDLGCKRNSSTDGCTSKNGETVDILQELGRVEWEDIKNDTITSSRLKAGECKGLVSKSANWAEENTCTSLTCPAAILSRTRWQSSSMCFMHSWNTGFAAICMAARLSQCRVAGASMVMRKSLITCKYYLHVASSLVAFQEHENFLPLTSTWEDNPYSILSLTKTECRENCSKDCECEAALFKEQECRKQKFPLRFGRERQDNSGTTIIKERFGSSNTTQVSKRRKKQQGMGVLIGSSVILAFAVGILAITGILIYRSRVREYKNIKNQGNDGLIEEVSLRSYTYGELEKATNGFTDEVGKGAFGTVFKGVIDNGKTVVAVKRQETVVAKSEREFRNEMKAIGRTHHKNLVKLFGYCHDGTNLLLVYEYMSNGSLADFLFKSRRKPSWEEKTRIALNVARGILYLHDECENQIIHCDIKPENILMDEQKCTKIADFGLAKLLMPNQTRTYTGIRGTRGYVAPEWHRNLPITLKADVYSFGIMLLEIICGRRNVDVDLPEEEVVLANWVFDCFEAGELDRLVKDEQVEMNKLERMVRVGLWCIQEEPSFRPTMKRVVLMLEGTVEIPAPPSPTPFSSAM